ncbi:MULTISPECIES: hypothetical protein [Nocardiopsis]|nr:MULTISPECIES: hypothetical protein [Nocardiopsis]
MTTVTEKIAMHLKLLLGMEDSILHRRKPASYALFFFVQASDGMVRSVTTEVNVGAPNNAAGQMWIQELRATAFAVLEEAFSEDRVQKATTSWARSGR